MRCFQESIEAQQIIEDFCNYMTDELKHRFLTMTSCGCWIIGQDRVVMFHSGNAIVDTLYGVLVIYPKLNVAQLAFCQWPTPLVSSQTLTTAIIFPQIEQVTPGDTLIQFTLEFQKRFEYQLLIMNHGRLTTKAEP
jgi:hypothetical protein